MSSPSRVSGGPKPRVEPQRRGRGSSAQLFCALGLSLGLGFCLGLCLGILLAQFSAALMRVCTATMRCWCGRSCCLRRYASRCLEAPAGSWWRFNVLHRPAHSPARSLRVSDALCRIPPDVPTVVSALIPQHARQTHRVKRTGSVCGVLLDCMACFAVCACAPLERPPSPVPFLPAPPAVARSVHLSERCPLRLVASPVRALFPAIAPQAGWTTTTRGMSWRWAAPGSSSCRRGGGYRAERRGVQGRGCLATVGGDTATATVAVRVRRK